MRTLTACLIATLAIGAAVAAKAQPYYGPGPGSRDTIVCESSNGRYNQCRLPWRGNARLVQQLSSTACVRGQTWGSRGGSVWVNGGCRGRFAPAGYGPGGGGWAPPSGWNQRFEVRCASPQYQYAFCQVDVGRSGRVYVRRQISGSACVEGRTWGWNRAGVWVNNGCEAVFTVDRRW